MKYMVMVLKQALRGELSEKFVLEKLERCSFYQDMDMGCSDCLVQKLCQTLYDRYTGTLPSHRTRKER